MSSWEEKETPGVSTVRERPGEDMKKSVICKVRREVSPGTNTAVTLVLNLQPPWLWENFCLFFFLGPHTWHMEVPRLGVESELQLSAYAIATATPDPSCIRYLHHSSWHPQILDPLSKSRNGTCILMDTRQIRFCCTTMGTPQFLSFKLLWYCVQQPKQTNNKSLCNWEKITNDSNQKKFFFFWAVPRACRCSWARDWTFTRTVITLDP